MKLDPRFFTDTAVRIIELLRSGGYEAFFVGGCVRDCAMGAFPHDYDITTSAAPEDVCRVFSAFKTFTVGMSHGTVSVVADGKSFEITTYRTDGKYSDCRHPDEVIFSRRLSDDLSRRDFTINALCAAPPDYEVTDMFGGLADIKACIIKCIGDPEERFSEDALRIMRALRFAAKLDFYIEKDTARAARVMSGLLRRISSERITAELCSLLLFPSALSVIENYIDIINVILPGASAACLKFLYSDGVPPLSLAMAALMCRLSPDEVFIAMRSLKFERRLIDGAVKTLSYPDKTPEDEASMYLAFASHGADIVGDAIKLSAAVSGKTADMSLYNSCRASGRCVSLDTLAVRGEDFSSRLSGSDIGRALRHALNLVASGEVANEHDEIMKKIFADYRKTGNNIINNT
ncbi:MAG: hypothetical protein VB118_06325 [Oscillospiraceae bacterium]|nr:hypothetical protein [Oscillospiraceae bacterium]